jgi:phosphotransacetylase
MAMGVYKRRIVEDYKKEFGIDVESMIELGILDLEDARKWLVKRLYYRMAREERTYTDIKNELSDRYEISVSAIEKWIYRK